MTPLSKKGTPSSQKGTPSSKKVALVTGGAKRIGGAISRTLAQAGYAVVIHCNTSPAEAETLAADIRHLGGCAAVVRADLTDAPARAGLIAAASQPFGSLHLLVNNASLFERDEVGTLTLEGIHANLATNLVAPVLLAQDFAKALGGDSGVIINLIDQRVLRPNPQFFSYTLAKSALLTATKTLAQALAPRVRVNAVGPGPTLPNTHEGAEGLAHEAAGTLLEMAVPPEEIARAVLFLAQSPHVTGQMIAVDSGQHLGWKTPDILD